MAEYIKTTIMIRVTRVASKLLRQPTYRMPVVNARMFFNKKQEAEEPKTEEPKKGEEKQEEVKENKEEVELSAEDIKKIKALIKEQDEQIEKQTIDIEKFKEEI